LLKIALTPWPPLPKLGEGVPEAEWRAGVRACHQRTYTGNGRMTTLIEFLEAELARRAWRPADLARAANVPDATISHILNGSRRAGPEVCSALARGLDEPPERIFRLAGLLPPLPPAVEEEHEAVRILRGLPSDLRAAAMRILRSLVPGASPTPVPGGPDPTGARSLDRDRDPYLEVLEQLWDKTPDWKKKDIAAQIRIAVEEYQREQGASVAGQGEGEASEAERPLA
jgi:transcriptional regulator with XRE-family HTH domain